jgi:uncharacterized protein involved in exopolysaccharide biosynthesis
LRDDYPVSNDSDPLQDGDELNLLGICRMLWRYKLLIAGVTALCVAAALVLAFTATPVYRSEVVSTEVRDSDATGANSISERLGGLSALTGVSMGTPAGVNPQAQAVLHSRRLVEEFITRNGLLDVLAPPGKPPPTLWRAVTDLQNGVIGVREDKRAGTVIVSVDWKDPEVAAKWANDFIALANETLRARAIAESQLSIDFLNAQVAKTNLVEVRQSLFGLVERETKKLTLANARTQYAFAIVDPAVAPELRIWPRRKELVVVGMGLGAVLGILAAFLVESLRSQAGRAAAVSRSPQSARS